ncbi:hypothetical protein [Longirhabdus pacifica]|uniref:hypothetical protein n=1 Tax=Longirhabdus pacifica TaxID=2305227 RepID=UPI0010091EBF|nr:hypothetical protein [Longirhabdus pacifica]
MIIDITLYETSLIPAIMFIVWILGKQGIPAKLLPIFALILGIASSLSMIEFTLKGLVIGILLAANAVGIHSGTKNVIHAFTDKKECK